ncbi:DUF3761 domain-containing protein [Actinomycetospora atypica]|uniref:DUF3761 domain-containing protein n=1 Tax=Actinomycetospora atypica TaxID=1290095 RepID=A0ABV9YMV2_9PSEU
MSQNAARGNDHDDAPTTVIRTHRPGLLGTTHARQLHWHPVVRVLWWMFLLPVAIFAWSSWRLRGAARGIGYAAAGVVLLFGVLVSAVPAAAPPAATVAASAPLSASATPATTPSSSPVVPAPAPAPVPAPRAVAALPPAPVARPIVRAATPRPAYAVPAAPRKTAGLPGASSGGNALGSTYTNVDGNQVQRPVAAAAQPAGASAKCKDGTWSFSQHRSGTCSGHGGVASWV